MSKVLTLVFGVIVSLSSVASAAEQNVVVITIDGLPSSYFSDPHASLPVIRGLAKSGVAAVEGMHVSNPSVTWPNHTTLMTGVHPEKHGVLFNGGLERLSDTKTVRVNPKKTQQELVKVPLLFDVIKEAGLTSAAINWPCTRGSTSIDDNFPDVPDNVLHSSPRLVEELTQSGVLRHFEDGGSIVRDEVWTDAACHVIRQRKPRLLALHLLNLDTTHHRFGPNSDPGYTAAALCDAMVGRIVKAIDDAGLRDRTTIFLVADHGFAAIEKTLKPNAVLRREGLITVEKGTITSARAVVVPEGGTGLVYLTNPETATQDAEAVRRLFQGAEGIVTVLGPDDFARYRMPTPATHKDMADLILVAKDGYTVSGVATGDEFVSSKKAGPTGSHGFVSTEPKMNAIFVASGPSIKTGVKLESLDNSDVAPTVARILGVPLKQATGRILSEILAEGN
ncbi:alkaline phosphatase family protein [Singulisphaera acidiphila]|uniref:Putative AP superfamily protein n=1 Tax=Singulisphaera acidiphila (strain ATCC BAA-1392 / DSM 18658 / VKM B-2454 / MOB10) TaxID=886293 RepID=L0DC67_SINAD|nr:nucleotide pyrophosphatase/phosphodiesterase family protein [Singulisphaera acidiphila]AGA26450.1 putative AP superfamily protein [Singulisphaera acidiphila DSM 18658]